MNVCNQKRILYLRTDIGTQDLIGGGSVAHTTGVLKGFVSLGAYVICASTAMHTLLRRMPIDFVPLVVPTFLQRISFKLSCLVSNILFYRKLKKIIRERKIDIIYQRYSMLNMLGVALAHQCTISLYLEFNGSESWVDAHWSPQRRLKIGWLIDKIELLNLRHAAKIIVVSQVLKEQLLARGINHEKIYVCPNGVDPAMFEPHDMLRHREKLRAQYALQEKFIFCFSSTFRPWHGVELLAYVIPRVAKQHDRAHFLLPGDGQLKQMLYDALAQADLLHRVTFTGMLPADQVPAYLAMSDAFLCPTQPNPDGSRFFGSPTKLFEYMMVGKPIIATSVEQIGEVLQCSSQQFLIRPDDYEGFADAMLKLLNMPEHEQVLLGDALKAYACKQHTWQAHVRSFM